jgi:hypothetical protein
MKNLFIALLFLIQPIIVFSQTKADAEHVMGVFMKFYNAGKNDSIYNLLSVSDKKMISKAKNADDMKWYKDNFGAMLSFEYLGIDNEDDNVIVFKTNWSKGGKKTSSFTLDKENKFLTFRLGTSSPGIDKLLKNH